MSKAARVTLALDQPAGVVVAEIGGDESRLVTGLASGPGADATHLADELARIADQTAGPIALDLRTVSWIDSGACAVLVRFWKELRGKGRALTLSVTDPVRETFRITGLSRLIPCFADLVETIDAARTAQSAATPELRVG